MATYIILSRFSPNSFKDPKEFKSVAMEVSKRIKQDCPNIRWKESYATLGRFDVIDIIEPVLGAAKDGNASDKSLNNELLTNFKSMFKRYPSTVAADPLKVNPDQYCATSTV